MSSRPSLTLVPASPSPPQVLVDCSSKFPTDPLFEEVQLTQEEMKLVNTLAFQSMKYIRQLGDVHFVFPSACGDRYTHSLQVCEMATRILRHLREIQPELGITDDDLKCLRFAALSHDLGHYSKSHLRL